jgi:hypothetical protein
MSVEMSIEVCVVKVSTSMIQIYTYNSTEDFEADRPVAVYVVFRGHLLLLPPGEVRQLLGIYENVVFLEEAEAVNVYNNCKRARRFITIPVL